MTLRAFIRSNRSALHTRIDAIAPHHPRNDAELELWIMNNESLYTWARESGVHI